MGPNLWDSGNLADEKKPPNQENPEKNCRVLES
jgi:hypothetical protein